MNQEKIAEIVKKMQEAMKLLENEIDPNGEILSAYISRGANWVLINDKTDQMKVDRVTFDKQSGALTTYYIMTVDGIDIKTNETKYLPEGTLPDCEYEVW